MPILVKDVMTRNVVTLDSYDSVKKAAEYMAKYDIGCLIVMKDGNPEGIVTERDMLKRVLLEFRDPRLTRVEDIMSTPLMASSVETELSEAMRLMNERRIKKLPVVDNGHLIGLLTLTDVVRSVGYLEHVITSMCSRCRFRSISEIVP